MDWLAWVLLKLGGDVSELSMRKSQGRRKCGAYETRCLRVEHNETASTFSAIRGGPNEGREGVGVVCGGCEACARRQEEGGGGEAIEGGATIKEK